MRASRGALAALLAVAFAAAVAGCGGGSPSKPKKPAAGPAAGRPPVTIGTKNFPEEFLLGELYARALRAKGFRVSLKSNVGATEIIYRALTSGTLDMYPEYTGVLGSVIGNIRRQPSSEGAAYLVAKRVAARDRLDLLDRTPFSDRDVLVVKPSFASRYRVSSIPQLSRVPRSVTVAGPPEFRTREQGFLGLEMVYGLKNLEFRPLRIGEQYGALDSGKVDAADAFSTDGQLRSGHFVVLKDPRNLFGFQNAAPLVRREVVRKEGPLFAATLNAVSAKLTTQAMRRMNAAVVLKQRSPGVVAESFLRSNGLK
jgi:osmoprotectant transport system substrate-binding protein